jgi:hypothetical protein
MPPARGRRQSDEKEHRQARNQLVLGQSILSTRRLMKSRAYYQRLFTLIHKICDERKQFYNTEVIWLSRMSGRSLPKCAIFLKNTGNTIQIYVMYGLKYIKPQCQPFMTLEPATVFPDRSWKYLPGWEKKVEEWLLNNSVQKEDLYASLRRYTAKTENGRQAWSNPRVRRAERHFPE